jgi:hypothetical protein
MQACRLYLVSIHVYQPRNPSHKHKISLQRTRKDSLQKEEVLLFNYLVTLYPEKYFSLKN